MYFNIKMLIFSNLAVLLPPVFGGFADGGFGKLFEEFRLKLGNFVVRLPEAQYQRHSVGAEFGVGLHFGLVLFGQPFDHLFGVVACRGGANEEVVLALDYLFRLFDRYGFGRMI